MNSSHIVSTLAFLALAACGSGPKTFAQITKALETAPTGTVDATTAKQAVTDNLLRDGLATAIGAAELRVPYGYALSATACTNVAKDGSPLVTQIDLATTGDGVSTGKLTSTLRCKSTASFTFEFLIQKACVRDECFEGSWNLEGSDTKLTWTMRGYRTTGTSTVRRLVDMGGSNEVTGEDKFTKAKFVAFIGEKEPQPNILLEWGNGGPNKYTQFSLTGGNGKFVCASTDNGKTGDCAGVDAAGKPTNTNDFSF